MNDDFVDAMNYEALAALERKPTSPIDDLKDMVDRTTEFMGKPQIVEVVITRRQMKGRMQTKRIEDDDEMRSRFANYKEPRRLLLHPDDWEKVLREFPTKPPDVLTNPIGAVFGIPVRKEDG